MSDAHKAAGPPTSVLVIGDNMDTADSLARFLRVGVGHEVRVDYDGATGLRMIAERVPDMVVCDIAMPKVSGLRVSRPEVCGCEPQSGPDRQQGRAGRHARLGRRAGSTPARRSDGGRVGEFRP